MLENWFTIIIMAIYTIATVGLFIVTYMSAKNTNELLKLNVILALNNIYKPAYGMHEKEYIKWQDKWRGQITKLFNELELKDFSRESKMILSELLNEMNNTRK